MAKITKRSRILVDRHVQGALVLRLLVYWAAFLVSFLALYTLWSIFVDPLRPIREVFAEVGERAVPAVLASAWLLPVVLYDLVRLSNRFVGPVLRLRGALASLAKGETIPPVHFRKDDFWIDLAAQFNAASARIAATSRPAPPRKATEDEPIKLEEVAV